MNGCTEGQPAALHLSGTDVVYLCEIDDEAAFVLTEEDDRLEIEESCRCDASYDWQGPGMYHVETNPDGRVLQITHLYE